MALDFQAIVKTTPNEFVLTFNLKFSSFLEFWQDWTKMQNAGHRHKFREQLLAQSLVRVLKCGRFRVRFRGIMTSNPRLISFLFVQPLSSFKYP